MIQEVKLRKIGNSVGIVLSKEVLSKMHAKDGDSVYLTEGADGEIRMTPYNPEFAKKIQVAESLIGRYRNTLKELAK
jgi:putative addiction module antidote